MKNANWYLIGFLALFSIIIWLDCSENKEVIEDFPELVDQVHYIYSDQVNELIGGSYMESSTSPAPYQNLSKGDFYLLHYSKEDSTLFVRIKEDSGHNVSDVQYEQLELNIDIIESDSRCIDEAISLYRQIGDGENRYSGKKEWHDMLTAADVKFGKIRIEGKRRLGGPSSWIQFSFYRIPILIFGALIMIYLVALLDWSLFQLIGLPKYIVLGLFILLLLVARLTASLSYLARLNNTSIVDLLPSVYTLSHVIPVVLFFIFVYFKKSKWNNQELAKDEMQKFSFIVASHYLFIMCSSKLVDYSYMGYNGIDAGDSYLALGVFNEAFIFATANFLNNFRAHYYELRRKGKSLKVALTKGQTSQSELEALQSRINPHFLYNSLNSIASLAKSNPDKTEQMAIALSNFYKYNTNRQDELWTTIGEEMGMVETYLDIEKIRFEDQLGIQINVDEGCRNYKIPRFIIQPLVENAVKYGYDERTGKINITVGVIYSEKDNSIDITIQDGGQPFTEDLDAGYGFNSVQKKLKIAFGENHRFGFINSPKKSVNITINNPEAYA